MPTEGDVTQIVREWLRTDVDASAERVVDDVLAILDTAPMVRVRGRVEASRRDAKVVGLLALAAAIVLAFVGVEVMSSPRGAVGGPGPSSSSTRSPAATSEKPPHPAGDIGPSPYSIPLDRATVHLMMPADWTAHQAGRQISKAGDDASANDPLLVVGDVKRVVVDACPGGDAPIEASVFRDVGPTVDDLTSALSNIGSLQVSQPIDSMLGGYPAKRLVIVEPPGFGDRCGGPEGRLIWDDVSGSRFGVLNGGTATVYVVDAAGQRVVIATHYRGASSEDVAGLDAVVASIDIDSGITPIPVGRRSMTVNGIPFSFRVSTRTDGGWADFGGVSINKSVRGPQGAEGIIYWTGLPDGAHTEPCAGLGNLPVDSTPADVAAAVARAPGVDLVSAPSDVTVGGRPAKHVVVTVTQDFGCDPGYLFSWHETQGGPLWGETRPGDTISAWIVDVDGRLLFIASEVAGPRGAYGADAWPDAERASMVREMQQIVDSIEFE